MVGVCDAVSYGGMYAGRVESLRKQVPVHAPHGSRFLERYVMSQPPLECLLDQKVFIEVSENLRDGRSRHVACDADRLDLSQRSQSSMTLNVRFRPREGQRGSAVVQRALVSQAGDSRLDVVWFEPAPREARTDLCLAQLTPSE